MTNSIYFFKFPSKHSKMSWSIVERICSFFLMAKNKNTSFSLRYTRVTFFPKSIFLFTNTSVWNSNYDSLIIDEFHSIFTSQKHHPIIINSNSLASRKKFEEKLRPQHENWKIKRHCEKNIKLRMGQN